MAEPLSVPVVLDISRTVSRLGLGAGTGIDRVERAYLDEVLARVENPIFLTRLTKALAVLDREGISDLLDLQATGAGYPLDLIARLSRRVASERRMAESLIRARALRWSWLPSRQRLVENWLPDKALYLNVGHAHLSSGLFATLGGRGTRSVVLIHDMIPLDYPEFTRSDTVRSFEQKMKVVSARADTVICNSDHTAQRVTDWMSQWGRVPDLVVAPLGIPPLPEQPPAPVGGPSAFAVLGTIEPRKNHALLLDIWERFHKVLPPGDIPRLHIIGRRGWQNSAVFQTLDSAPFMGDTVIEHGFVDDAEVRAIVAGCRAVLFPSFAEGFGYPIAEALQLGVPVLASDLPSLREIAGAAATYLPPSDRDAWTRCILAGLDTPAPNRQPMHFPDWDAHFETVWKALDR